MNVAKLANSAVIFDSAAHKYYLNDKELSGVTSIIKNLVFGGTLYNNIPEDVLEKARKRGTEIHSEIQMEFEGFPSAVPSAEFTAFAEWRKKNKTKFIASEYLVSNNINIASSIDLVDRQWNLYDIKTTAELNIEYLRWQLSIYKYLLMLQNNLSFGFTNHLYALHLRNGECKCVEIEPIPMEFIGDLINAFTTGTAFVNPLHTIAGESDLFSEYRALSKDNDELKALIDANNTRLDEIKKQIIDHMDNVGITKHESDYWKITRTPDTTRLVFDDKRFAVEHKSSYNKYLVEKKIAGRLTVTIK